jgi:hypothetical protein
MQPAYGLREIGWPAHRSGHRRDRLHESRRLPPELWTMRRLLHGRTHQAQGTYIPHADDKIVLTVLPRVRHDPSKGLFGTRTFLVIGADNTLEY